MHPPPPAPVSFAPYAPELRAYGAKLTGAGGGGCMVALTDSPQEVADAIEKAQGTAIISGFAPDGVLQV